ncbi:MAG: hypothetical protein AB3N18_06740 [Allomuricauda sp.]
MKSYHVKLLFTFVFGISLTSSAQDHILNYNLKKGEAFDIILLTTKKDTKELFGEYRKKAFPIAFEMGYSQIPGFNITETVQGNLQPSGMIFGKWKNFEKREAFIEEINVRVPNFHQMRKDIWSIFNLIYYKVPEDTSFQLDSNKVIVATAYWKKNGRQSEFNAFISNWKALAKQTGASVKLELTHGKSPFGYYYNPDYLAITQWDNREDFEAFLKRNLEMDTQNLKNVNQYILGK